MTGDRVSLNETAYFMLSLVDGRRTAKDIGEAVAAIYGLAPRQVTSDFLQIAALLNEKCLLNFDTPLRSRCATFPRSSGSSSSTSPWVSYGFLGVESGWTFATKADGSVAIGR